MLIRVSNLDRSTSADDLWDLFAEFGEVEEVEINDEPDPGKLTFTGWVVMPFEADRDEALSELKGERVDGRVIQIFLVKNKEEPLPSLAAPVDADWDEEDED